MGVLIGKDLIVSTTVDGAPKRIAGQRECSLSFDRDNIDITCKNDWTPDSGEVGYGMKKSVTGFGSWKVSCGGLIVSGDTAFGILQQAYLNATTVMIQFSLGADQSYQGECHITSLNSSGALGDAATYTAEFAGAGSLTEIVPAVQTVEITDQFVAGAAAVTGSVYTAAAGVCTLSATPEVGLGQPVVVKANGVPLLTTGDVGYDADTGYTRAGAVVTLGTDVKAATPWIWVSYTKVGA